MSGGNQPHTDRGGETVLYSDDLTEKQFMLCLKARRFPFILETRGEAITAASLQRRGFGTVEDGASGQRIFRLSQDGCDAFEWLDMFANDDLPPGWRQFA